MQDMLQSTKRAAMFPFVFFVFLQFCPSGFLQAQSELMAWGNLAGIRVEGQLMEFESSLRLVGKDWAGYTMTAKERQHPQYYREGNRQTVTTGFGGSYGFRSRRGPDIVFKQVVEDVEKGEVSIKINTSVNVDTVIQGIYYCIDLPSRYYSDGNLQFINASLSGKSKLNIADVSEGSNRNPFKISARGLTASSDDRQLTVSFNSKEKVFVRKESGNTQVYIELMGAKLKKGKVTEKKIAIIAKGKIDNSLVEIELDVKNPGRKFEGLGGNFRLQNPQTDPAVIQYCLDNLRVAWGRVEMPWNFWHPEEDVNPIESAEAGNLNPRVKAAMEMARRLAAKGMPVIISDWSPPSWAVVGDSRNAFRPQLGGLRGLQLDPGKSEKIYQSIGDYIEYMKNNFGVEAEMFSFNESDLGIYVRHTGEEHAEFIKGLGAHLASRGLATKLLLGDNSDATTFDFIIPAMNDLETHKYIGAISFHSWRGCTDEILNKWAGAAKKMNLPLLIGEGSTDAAAWNYPEIFSEQSFALYEINLYTRICAICQPLSILQWQLTADYSVLIGNGVFGTEGSLKPTQRFWNLKQLASTPEDPFSIPFKCNKEGVNCAAFGNIARGEYAIHIVNNGAECKGVIKGIPSSVSEFDVYVTDSDKGMEKVAVAKVREGIAELILHPAAFVTLISK